MLPIIADGEAGFGGPLNLFELTSYIYLGNWISFEFDFGEEIIFSVFDFPIKLSDL